MRKGTVFIFKTWRSEAVRLAVFLVLCGISVVLSRLFPGSVIHGRLFNWGTTEIFLSLPLFWLIPLGLLGDTLLKIYDVRYAIDSRGIEARSGILSFSQRIIRIRFEDIRSVETDQTLTDRFLGIGTIEIGTAATGGIEMVLEGVGAPHEIQGLIQAERDRRQQLDREPSPKSERPEKSAANEG